MNIENKNYLAQFDKTAESEKLALVMHWINTEPLPFFKQLREERPVLVTPGATFLALYEDVIEVLQLPKIFTVALYKPKMADYLMAHDDDALHYREKSLMQAMLNRDDLPLVREMVANIAKKILDEAGGKIELVNDYCRMVPATLVQDYFGLDGVDQKDLIEWSYWTQYDTFHNQPFDTVSDAKRAEITANHDATGVKLGKYIIELVVRKTLAVKAEQAANVILWMWFLLVKLARLCMGKPTPKLKDDVVTRMIRSSFPEEVDFSIKRLGINAGGLLIGSIETTSQAVSQIVQELFSRPDVLAQAKAAAKQADTAIFDGIVWEALRYVPIGPFLFRQTASDYVVAKGTDRETTLKAGSYVLPITQSAMFDPRVFEKPDEFMSDRNWYHYFHFGFGSHECLGKYVGMVMIPEMVRQVLLRSEVRADAPIDYKQGPFPEDYRLSFS